MSKWHELDDELEAWGRARRAATMWWRDDDAVEPSPALDRLLDLAAASDIPLSLAVIPARASLTLAERLGRAPCRIAVLQHGFDHANHALEGQKRSELAAHRPHAAMCEELARGRAILGALFDAQAIAVLVPPWNRIAPNLIPALPGLGFRGISGYTARATVNPVRGLIECNTHVDVLRWRPDRGFLGEEAAVDLLIGHLRARRQAVGTPARKDGGAPDPDEPTGLLTHHLSMDEQAWHFVAQLIQRLARHAAVRWISARDAFGPPAGGGVVS